MPPRSTLIALPIAMAMTLSVIVPSMAREPAGAPAAQETDSSRGPCGAVESEGERFTVCRIDLRRQKVRLFLNDADGTPYSSLSNLARAQGSALSFAMNAGMYHDDLSPVGLYVENGREMKKVSTTNGPGNFHMKPNGIFYVAGDRAGVLDTARYLKAKPKADFATQSGPMLVIDGRIHPKISADGPSQKIRNGVGVRDDGRTAIFAISEQPVTFGAFARLFRDTLGCRNALFLDGSVSALHAPGLGRTDFGRPLGPIVGATSR